VFSTMGQMLDLLYQVARELVHWGQNGIAGKCCYLKRSVLIQRVVLGPSVQIESLTLSLLTSHYEG
jgi:hypothetical protein